MRRGSAAMTPLSPDGAAVPPTRGERPPYTGGTVSLHGAKGFPARVRREWYKQRKENEMTVKFITVKGPDRLARAPFYMP